MASSLGLLNCNRVMGVVTSHSIDMYKMGFVLRVGV